MVYFLNYLYFFLNPLLKILLLFYVLLQYWPLISHNFIGVVFASTSINNLVYLALISLSKLFNQSIYNLIFLFIFAQRPNPSIISIGRYRYMGLQVKFLKSFESTPIYPFVLFRDQFADEYYPLFYKCLNILFTPSYSQYKAKGYIAYYKVLLAGKQHDVYPRALP